MNHDRVAMLAALNLIKPAIAAKDLVEELAHVWFDGETITAYNDADLGIQVPFTSPFKGGIRGALILGLLVNSRAKEVIFELQDEGFVLLKAARAKALLTVLEPERAVYELPPASKNVYKFGDDFTTALKSVMISVGNDTSIPEKMGITLIVSKQCIDFYTTDSQTAAHVELAQGKDCKLKPGSRYIIPTTFCEQLLRLCGNGGELDLQEDIVTATNSDGVFIWARQVVISDKPFDFAGAFARHTDFPDEALFETPSRLSLALDRSLTMLDGLPDEPVAIMVDGGKLRLVTTAEGRGELKDSVDIAATVPAVTVKIPPNRIKRALGLTTHIAMTKQIVYMNNDQGLEYMATTKGGS